AAVVEATSTELANRSSAATTASEGWRVNTVATRSAPPRAAAPTSIDLETIDIGPTLSALGWQGFASAERSRIQDVGSNGGKKAAGPARVAPPQRELEESRVIC